MPKGLKAEMRRQRQLRRMKREAIELSPADKFKKMLALKKATRCIIKVEDEYNVYVKLATTFKELGELAQTEPFEGCEKCEELRLECEAKAEELKPRLPKEKVEESRTVMTSAKERNIQEKKNQKKGGKWIGVCAVLLVVVLVICYNVAPTRYYIAQAQHAVGLSKYAMDSYEELGTYKDSALKKVEMEQVLLAQASEGDEVVFGARKWIVIEKKENQVVLAANKALSNQPYHKEVADVTWENCSLRQYLNKDFVTKTFSAEEQAVLVDMESKADENETFRIAGGKDTMDKVTILSAEQVETYKGVLGSKMNNTRLRTPGKELNATCYVSYVKEIVEYGFPVEKKGALVRPIITVQC